MLINMQANCKTNSNDSNAMTDHVLPSTLGNKKSSVSPDYSTNFKSDYHQQMEIPDTLPRDHGIVGFCVKKQRDQSDQPNSITDEAYAKKQSQSSVNEPRKELQQQRQINPSIPSTLPTATDYLPQQLNLTKFVTLNSRIRSEAAPTSVTKSSEPKNQNKTGKGTGKVANLNARLKKEKELKARNENNHKNHLNENNSETGPILETCGTLVQKSKAIKRKETNNVKNLHVAENLRNNKAAHKKNSETAEKSENQTLSNQNQQPKTTTEFQPNFSNFVKHKAFATSRSRYHQLKLKSGQNLSKKSLYYNSALDLSYRKENKPCSDSNHRNLTLDRRGNAPLVIRSRNKEKKENHTEKSFNGFKSNVTPDKKRLCKSLSNLTAEDVLSVPCSSIFDRKPTPPNLRKNLRLSQINLSLKEPEISVYSNNTEVIPNNEMSKHLQVRQTKANNNWKQPAFEEKSNSQPTAMKSELIEDKRSEKQTSKKQSSNENLDKNFETKVTKKPPRLHKSLFPFPWKSRKKQNQQPQNSEKAKPMKVKESRNTQPSPTDSGKSESNGRKSMKEVMEDTWTYRNDPSCDDATGFKKLKVPSKQDQLNIHSAYATRAARVRSEGAKTPNTGSVETSPKSTSPQDQPQQHRGFMNLLGKDLKVVLRQKGHSKRSSFRLSTELYSSTESLPTRPLRKRPQSLAAPAKDTPQVAYSVYSKSSQNLSCFGAPSTSTEDQESCTRPSTFDESASVNTSHKHADSLKREDHSAAYYPRGSSFHNIQDLPANRCSFDMSELSIKTRGPTSQPIQINNGKSTDSLSAFNTPSSSILGTSYLSVARTSLASSYGSIYEEEDPLEKLEKSAIGAQEEEDIDFPAKASTLDHRKGNLPPKLKILSRHQTAPSNLHIESDKRRSISPSSLNNRFKLTHSQPGIVTGKPPSLPSSRNQSMKDLAHQKRPSKPTTPKPKKIGSAGSFSSLNKFNFQLSTPSIPLDFMQTDEASDPKEATGGSTQDVTLRNVDLRGHASAKNAQIRRRMSLQMLKSRNVEISEETRQIKEYEDFKRHSVCGLDFEKVKSTMSKWSVAPAIGSGNSNRRTRKRARPLSELQNFKWEVQAIPEHRAIVNTESGSNVLSESAPLDVFPEAVHQQPDVALQAYIHSMSMLGSCFSEEDLSKPIGGEFGNIFPLNRSHSANSNLNNISDRLLIHRLKSYWGTRRAPYSAKNSRVPIVTPFGQTLPERTRCPGSTVSGISNESGYGSMTRRGATLRPESGDEDVFTHMNPARLSNGDFPNEDGLYVEALWDHVTMDHDELGFKVGDVIRVIDMTNADWWWGELESKEGWFPATFVRILVNQHRECSDNCDDDCSHNEEEDCECSRVTTFGDEDSCSCGKRRSTSSIHCSNCGRPFRGINVPLAPREPKDSFKHPEIIVSPAPSSRKNSLMRDQIRKNVINEIVNSEKVFVGHLKDVIQGYLTRCRNRPDMFSDEQISLIFGNIEEIYQFQRKFAAELETAVNRSSVPETELGKIFLRHKSGFKIYSDYCNNHTQALALLSQLFTVKNYIQFFETCRLIQKMIDISLDGFLLTPVQKICKYPLQLAELLKYTSPDHPDYKPVQSALVAMKDVARMINERKRMMENIRKISIWQSSVLNWQGEDVLAKSDELVDSGEIFFMKQSKSKPKPRMVFLFDHQLIICKKDLLRKDLMYYKSRVDLDRYKMTPLEGYSPRSSANLSGDWSSTGSSSGQYGWRLTERKSGDSMLMMCKNEDDYLKWMKAFPREREIALSRDEFDFNYKEELAKDVLKTTLVLPRKPKDSSSIRAPNYRYRARMAQEANLMSKQKIIASAPFEKSSGGFFGKFTSFRRTTTRESSAVVY